MSSPIDRSSHLRRTAERDFAGSERRFLVFVDGKVVVTTGEKIELAHIDERSIGGLASRDPLFLGMVEETPLFSIQLAESDWDAVSLDPGLEIDQLTFRGAVASLDANDSGTLAYAEGMRQWHLRSRFCGVCGSETVPGDAGHVRRCASDECGRVWFPRLEPVVIMRIFRGDRILLGRHNKKRSSSFFSTIAGFVEPGETLEGAVKREVLEEVGLEVTGVRYLGSQPWPLPSSLMIAFEAEALTDGINVDPEELIEARWFTREELRSGGTSLPFEYSIAWRMINGWLEHRDL